MDERVEAIGAHLREYGLTVEPIEALEWDDETPKNVTVRRGRSSEAYLLVHLRSVTLSAVSKLRRVVGRKDLLVLAPRIHPRTAEELRHADVNFLDLSGNAYISFGSVLIDVRGRRSNLELIDAGRREADEAPRTVNLFSTKRAQVIFVLLQWPAITTSPLRRIAEIAGVSVGQVSMTLNELARAGYFDDNSRLLVKGEDLLESWTAAYRTTLGPAMLRGRFYGEIENFDAAGTEGVFVGGEAAVPELLQPGTLTLYSEQAPRRLIGTNRWRSDALPNIFVKRKFWRDPEDDEARARVLGLPLAPSLLIYADLRSANESRQREAAKRFRAEYVHM